MEEWERLIYKDEKIKGLLEKPFNSGNFILHLLRNSTVEEQSDILNRLTLVKQFAHNSSNQIIEKSQSQLIQEVAKNSSLKINAHEFQEKVKFAKKKIQDSTKSFLSNYEIINKKKECLRNVYKSQNLCKSAILFIQNLKIIKTKVGDNFNIQDTVRLSQISVDIEKIEQECDLSGLPFYDNSKKFLQDIKEAVIKRSETKLIDGLVAKNSIELQKCIQVFYTMGILTDKVQNFANFSLKSCMAAWKKCLTQNYEDQKRTQLIHNAIRGALKECYTYTIQILFFHHTLQGRDQKTLTPFDSCLKEKNLDNLFALFWQKQTHIISKSFHNVKESKDPNLQKNWKILIRLYPKLFSLFKDFCSSLLDILIINPELQLYMKLDECQTSLLNTLNMQAQYYEYIERSLQSTAQQILKQTFSKQQQMQSPIVYIDSITKYCTRFTKIVSNELKQNIRDKSILKQFIKIILKVFKCLSEQITSNLHQLKPEKQIVEIIYASYYSLQHLNYEIGNMILSCKQNYETDFESFDEALLPNIITLNKLRKNLFQLLHQEILNQGEESFKKYMSNEESSWKQNTINYVFQLFYIMAPKTNSIRQNQVYQEKFNKSLKNFIFVYFLAIFHFDYKDSQYYKQLLDELESFRSQLDKINQDSTLLRFYQSFYKIFLINEKDIVQMLQQKHNFFTEAPIEVLIVNCLRKLEQKSNLSLESVLKIPSQRIPIFQMNLQSLYRNSDYLEIDKLISGLSLNVLKESYLMFKSHLEMTNPTILNDDLVFCLDAIFTFIMSQ